MNEVKEICQRLLDDPAPPMRSNAEIVSVAHRAARRRSVATALGSGLAGATAVIATLAATTGVLAGPGPSPTLAATSAARVVLRPEPMPKVSDINTHESQIVALLRQAVPVALRPGAAETRSPWMISLPGGYVTSVRLSMSTGDGRGELGELEAYFRFGTSTALPEDLCSTAVTAEVTTIAAGADVGCQVFTIDGQSIRVTTGDDGLAQIVTATRFLDGGFITVVSRQGSFGGPPLTPGAVATVAASLVTALLR